MTSLLDAAVHPLAHTVLFACSLICKNILWEKLEPEKTYRKGEEILIISLLLASCDFLLKCSSAVSETAIYFNPTLQANSIDLQVAIVLPAVYASPHPPTPYHV